MDPYASVFLIQMAEKLIASSREYRSGFRYPKITLMLPYIRASTALREVSTVLDKIGGMGIEVRTAEDFPRQFPPISEVMSTMSASFSSTLNIDCSVLLAFVSDFSNGPLKKEEWHGVSFLRRKKEEARLPLLPEYLWPACGSKRLVCTRDAAVKMQEVLETYGTRTEKERAALVIDFHDDANMTKEERLQKFQELSHHTVPSEWNIPVQIVDVDITSLKSQLPEIAEALWKRQDTHAISACVYGWAKGLTTLSSNKYMRTMGNSLLRITELDGRLHCPISTSHRGDRSSRRKKNVKLAYEMIICSGHEYLRSIGLQFEFADIEHLKSLSEKSGLFSLKCEAYL